MRFLLFSAFLSMACSSQSFSTDKSGANGKDAGSPGGGTSQGGSGTGAGGAVSGGGSSSGGSSAGGRGGAGTGGVGFGGSDFGGSGGSSGAGTGGSSGAGAGGVGVGGSGMGGGSSADAGSIQCTGANPTFPEFDRGCTSVDSCVLVSHMTNCCGSTALMGINHAERARFDAAEAICDAQYPKCGCAAFGINLDDGTLVASASEAVADCVNGQCLSRYNGQTFACGDKTCTATQYCTQASGGAAGSPTTFTCTEDANCAKSCGSCSSASAGCACNSVQGHTVITCAYP